jgi:hypothetical protein
MKVVRMSEQIKVLEDEMLRLGRDERARLAERLIVSLDDKTLGTPEAIERWWLEESARRYEMYRRSGMSSQAADQAIAELLAERD